MRSIALCMMLLGGCDKSAAPSTSAAPGSVAAPAPPTAWATDRPAIVPVESVALLESLQATLTANEAALASPDCTKEVAALRALIPDTQKLSALADSLDALSARDATAKTWLTDVYQPRITALFRDIGIGIKSTQCKEDPGWRAAAMEWSTATGFKPQ